MEEIQAARDELIATHAFVIADAPGEEGEAANTVTLLSDFAIIPLQPTKPDVRALKDSLKTIRLAHAVTHGKRPEAVLVLNCVRKRNARSTALKEQLRGYGFRVADSEVRRLDALAESCDSAVTRGNNPRAGEAAADIEALFSELFSDMLSLKRTANG
jgi:cellulose biosynthesis protein BcsQ